MLETVITLKPQSEWRRVDTWYSGWAPEWLKPVFRPFTSDRISQEELVNQLDEALKLPGVSNAWTMPIKARIDMLTTGIRTPLGLKVSGDSLETIEEIGTKIESLLPPCAARATSSPSAPAAASSSTSSGTATSWRATA